MGRSISERLDRYQRRRPGASFPIAVAYKFVDDYGAYLSALIAYYAFVSVIPLLLLSTTVLGWVLVGHPEWVQHIESSALSQLPVVGSQLLQPRALSGGPVGLIIGIVGSLYGGLGVGQAVQYAMNVVWAVPRNQRPNPFKARGRGVLLLATAGLAVLGTTVLSALGSSNVGSFGLVSKVVVLAASVAVNAVVFVFVFRVATARPLSYRDVAPGAVVAAVAWQLLQTFGVAYVGHVVKNASAVNSVFALVLGLLAFLYLAAVTVVVCGEINVVRVRRLYPRSLLSPFTEDVDLTRGDERTYRGQAEATQAKDSQDIDVTFRRDQAPGREN